VVTLGRRRPPLLETLGHAPYRRFWLGGLCANTTRWMDLLVLGWVALQLTGSPLMIGLAAFCRTVPMMLLGPVAGLIADRVHWSRIMIWAHTVGIGVAALLALAFATGHGRFSVLLALEVVLGIAWAIEFTTRRTLVYSLVGPQRLASAMSLETVSMQLAKMLGPVVGGLVLARLGTGPCYVVLAVLYVGALSQALVLRRHLGAPARGPLEPVVASLGAGLRAVWRRPVVRGVLVITAVMNLLVFPYQQMLPVFARDVYRVGPELLGLLLAADGLGALMGALTVAARRDLLEHGLLFAGGAAATAALLLVFSVSPLYAVALPLLLVLGVAESLFATMQSTIVMLAVPDGLRGRAMGMLSACMGTAPFGALWLGFLAGQAGAPVATASGAVLALALMGRDALRLARSR
jgi:predicted MFS family arabinose efflux permease